MGPLLALLIAQLAGTPGAVQTPNAGRWTSQQGTFLQSGTGAILRTIESKLRDAVAVKDFACVGDGVTDDSTCVANTITAAGANQVIDFSCPGNYKTTLYGTIPCGDYYPPLAATGAIPRSVPGRLFDSIDIRDFGAKGDGTTDDTTAIQNAVNFMTPPGTLSFPGQLTYKINGTITLPIGISIAGNGSTLDVTGNTGVVFNYSTAVLSFFNPSTVFQGFRVNGSVSNTSTTLVQTTRVPYFMMRDVIANGINIAKVNGGAVFTKFDHVIAYAPVGKAFWFTIGADSFGANFSELDHVWIENAQNSGVIGVLIDAGDVRVHNSYIENVPLGIKVNGGNLDVYDSSFSFRGWATQGIRVDAMGGAHNPSINISACDFNYGEDTSAANTAVAFAASTQITLVATNNRFRQFNQFNSIATAFQTVSPNGQIFGSITGNTFFSQVAGGYIELLTVFDPTTVTNGFGYVAFNGNFLYGEAGATPAQIDITKSGATGSLFEGVFTGNTFLRATNFLRLNGGTFTGNNFLTASTVTWIGGSGGRFFGNTGTLPTLTNALSQSIETGLAADGSGLKHKRGTAGCATAAAIGAVCQTVVTWTTAFPDANYTATCNGRVITSGVPVAGGFTAQVAASVTFQTVATTAVAAQYTNIDCVAVHD